MKLLNWLDLYKLDYAVVRARNRLDFALRPKGDRQARKIFCLGPAKSGTSSLHALFQSNGLTTLHSAGNWPVADFDCFSDRGDYRPVEALSACFPNAVFILNCRPLGSYLRSIAVHRSGQRSALPEALVNPSLLVGQARRRAEFSLRVLKYFSDKTNLICVDIEKSGSISFLADRLGLQMPPETHHHRTTVQPSLKVTQAIDAAKAALGGPAVMGCRLILTDQPETEVLADILPAQPNLWL